jgi:hypothetical protein
MAEWPTLDELKQRLDVVADDWDGEGYEGEEVTRLSRALEAAITYIKRVIGEWDDDVDVPDAGQAEAALQVAVFFAERPESNAGDESFVARFPNIQRLVFGTRRRFGVA